MLIPVNQNIDEYKDDFYKGLTLRQSVISLVTVAVGVLVSLLFFVVFAHRFAQIHLLLISTLNSPLSTLAIMQLPQFASLSFLHFCSCNFSHNTV